MMEIEEKYSNTLKYIFEQLPMFSRVGAIAYKADLNNIIQLCALIGNPHLSFKSIHVGGTNGKGSCSHLLSAVFQQAGYKTGLYTSPHIADFRERIRLDGKMIPEQFVIDFVEKIKTFVASNSPSFFEISVAMAFDFFAKNKVEIAIIEVGLGGLLDSTNIIIPEVALITNISLDHTNLLGNSEKEIAVQKAGIIKPNVPTVIGETQSDVETIFFTHAVLKKSPIFFADQIYQFINKSHNEYFLSVSYLKLGNFEQVDLITDLQGDCQTKNIKSVLVVLDLMRALGWKISHQHVVDAVKKVKQLTGLRGRFDVVHRHPTIVFDVSHNQAGIRQVLNQVNEIKKNKLWIILGFVADKDVESVLKIMPKDAFYVATQAPIDRAMPYQVLGNLSKKNDLQTEEKSSVTEALGYVLSKVNSEDVVLVTGSFFIMEEAYRYVEQRF
jgi:dihydrofolate synthase / folylpolyglutamate synthase